MYKRLVLGEIMNKKTIIAGLVFLSMSAQALTHEEIDYLTIDQVSIEEIPEEAPLRSRQLFQERRQFLQQNQQPEAQQPGGLGQQISSAAEIISQLNEVSVVIDTIVNLGEKVWAIIERGRPVIHNEVQSASAMPKGTKAWNQLAGWQPSKSASYRIKYKNAYGMKVVDFAYRVMFTYGGSYKGQGRYVTGATIIPADLYVAWGFKFNSNVTIPTVVNTGTEQYPVGGIQMNVNWDVSTVINHHQQTSSFFVDGNGLLKAMN